MCGIVGYISLERAIDRGRFDAMRDALVTRGPDGAGSRYFLGDRVALGHRRLAIIDLSEAAVQPMSNEDGTLWLTYNGELYNHLDLRAQLEARGHLYRSHCDAETVLHAFEEWGAQCVEHFRGIFSFAIWDSKRERLFAARDQLGVKPFYYQCTEHSLTFGSQPKAILESPDARRKVDPRGFADYLFYGVVPHRRSAFAGIEKLPPGHWLSYERGELAVSRYWTLQYRPEIFEFDDAVAQLRRALSEAVEIQLMSDVPWGTYLSGGIDSSLITAIASSMTDNPIPTLTVGFREKRSDERPFAQLVSETYGTEHREDVLTFALARRIVGDLADIYDEPYALGASLPMVFLARCTRRQDIKVVLAGDGADELFAGYRHYDAMNSASNVYESYRPHEAMVQYRSGLRLAGSEVPHEVDPAWRFQRFYPEGLPRIAAARLLDMHTYLPDEILVKVDRATMAVGVEARVPFLDKELVELAFRIDSSLVYREGERKALLKVAAEKWLPPSVLTQRKKGFSIPSLRWGLRPESWLGMIKTLDGGALMDLGLLQRDRFRRQSLSVGVYWLWKFYVAELWARRWL